MKNPFNSLGSWLGNALAGAVGEENLVSGLNTADAARKRSAGYYGGKPGASTGTDILLGALTSGLQNSNMPGSGLLAGAGNLALETGESGRQMTQALGESDLYGEGLTRDVLEQIASAAFPQSAGDVMLAATPPAAKGASMTAKAAPAAARAAGSGIRSADDFIRFASSEDLYPIIRNIIQGKTSEGWIKAGRIPNAQLERIKAGINVPAAPAVNSSKLSSGASASQTAGEVIPVTPTRATKKVINQVRKEKDPAKFLKEPGRYVREKPIRSAVTAGTVGVPLASALMGSANEGGSITPDQADAFLRDAALRDGGTPAPAAAPAPQPAVAPTPQPQGKTVLEQLIEYEAAKRAEQEPNFLEKLGGLFTSTSTGLQGGDPRQANRAAELPNRTSEEERMAQIIPQLIAFQLMSQAQQQAPLPPLDAARIRQLEAAANLSQAEADLYSNSRF